MSKSMAFSFLIGAALSGSFNSSIKSASGKIKTLGDDIQKMTAQRSSIQSIPKLRQEISETEDKFKSAQLKAKELSTAMSSIENPTKKDVQALAAAEKSVASLGQKMQSQREILDKTKQSLSDVGINVHKLADEEKRLTDQIDKTSNKMKIRKDYSDGMSSVKQKRQDYQSQFASTAAKGMTVYGLLNTAGDVNQAQGDLATLGVSEAGLQSITKSAQNFTSQYAGMMAPEFIRASYDIRSGIEALSETGVGEFTALAAMTGAATKSSVGVMTNLFAKGYGVYRQQFGAMGSEVIAGWDKMSAEEKDVKFGEFFSGGISAAVKKFRTDGQQMSDAISNLGAAATSAGYSMQDQFAILGTLQKTMSGSEAATKFRAFLASAAKAGDELGLSFVDAEGKLKRVPDILKQLKDKYGDTIDAVEKQEIKKAFGTEEAVAMIDLLSQDIDGLDASSRDLFQSMKKGKAATEEMAKAGQRGKEMELFKQAMSNIVYTVVKGVLPALSYLSSGIVYIGGVISAISDKFPMLTTFVGGGIIAFLALSAALTALGWAGTYVSAGYKSLTYVIRLFGTTAGWTSMRIKAVSAATRVWTAAQWLLNAAMTANPIGLIIVGVGLLIGLGVLLYKKWLPFQKLVDKVFGAIKKAGSFIGKLFGGGKTEVKTTNTAKTEQSVRHSGRTTHSVAVAQPAQVMRRNERTGRPQAVSIINSQTPQKVGRIGYLASVSGKITAPKQLKSDNTKQINNQKHQSVTIHSNPTIVIKEGNVDGAKQALGTYEKNLVKQFKQAQHDDRRTDLD